jgi:uncharacterized protein YecT (DUF1311 family)
MLFAVTLLLAGLAFVSGSVSGQTGVSMRGHYTYGHEVQAFQPCGTTVAYWVIARPEINRKLVEAHREFANVTYEGIFVDVAGWRGTEPLAGFADGYGGSWRVTRLDSASARTPDDCDGVAPPVWIRDESGFECDRAPTSPEETHHCLLLEVMSADGALQRRVEDVHASRGSDMYEQQRAWEERREVQCLQEYMESEGRTEQTTAYLRCRIRTSRERLVEL